LFKSVIPNLRLNDGSGRFPEAKTETYITWIRVDHIQTVGSSCP